MMKNFIPETIDLSITQDNLSCQKCGNFKSELDRFGLCQVCFYEEAGEQE